MSKYQRLPQSDIDSSKRGNEDSKSPLFLVEERNNFPFRSYLRSKVITAVAVSAAVLVCGYAFVDIYPSSKASDLEYVTPLATSSPDSWRPIPTLHPSIEDVPGIYVPNIYDPEALDAQEECPGYIASGVQKDEFGFSAHLKLAGKPCNVYGTDVEDLNLTVQYQSAERLSVSIVPTYLVSFH